MAPMEAEKIRDMPMEIRQRHRGPTPYRERPLVAGDPAVAPLGAMMPAMMRPGHSPAAVDEAAAGKPLRRPWFAPRSFVGNYRTRLGKGGGRGKGTKGKKGKGKKQ